MFSHDQEVLDSTIKELKVSDLLIDCICFFGYICIHTMLHIHCLQELKPQSKTFQLRPEYPTVPDLHKAFISFEKLCYTRIVKEGGHGVSIHGLRPNDIQNCWIQLKEFVDSKITVTTNIDLGFWQTRYIQLIKHNEFI